MLRDQGFLQGFGIDIKDAKHIGDEVDARIVGHDVTGGAEEGGRTAMENLLQKDPDINVVYTINEPAAAGAYQALKAVGKEKDVLLVSVDGGCPGVKNVKAGIIGATSMQFPLLMASKGIDAVAEYAKSGKKPELDPGSGFLQHGRRAHHRQAGPGPALPGFDPGSGEVLGLNKRAESARLN